MKQILFLFVLIIAAPISALSLNSHTQPPVVLITGASKGIGKGIAKVFASEGYTVVLAARNTDDLAQVCTELRENGAQVYFHYCDVCNPEDARALVNYAIQNHGAIDILCHNAGIYPEERLETMDLSSWQRVIDVNLTGTFNMVKACLHTMKAQNRGKIVVTSSISGPVTGLPGLSHYTASKGGVEGFIKTAAIELAKYNIQINSVQPGNILTEGLAELGETYLSDMTRAIPAGTLGTPEDIGHAVFFLSSDRANFITGQSLVVDGGQVLPESHYGEF